MPSKPFFRTIAAALALFALAAVASAQVTRVEGKVTLKQADGTVVPVPGAQVDIFRTDIKQQFQIKTDKKGTYTHAGIPFVGTYTVAVCAPGAAPTWASKIRFANNPGHNVELSPGDGSCLTLDKIKELETSGRGAAPGAPAGGGGGGESKEAKAAREEMAKKVAEVEEKNKKITATNEVISRTFKTGNEALNANKLEEAIAAYKEGLAARADEPALLTNLSEALRRRGVERFNASIKAEGDARNQGLEAAKKDWTEAAAHSAKALEIVNTAPADPQQAQIYAQNKLAALSTRALAMKLVATKVDQSQAAAAWQSYQDYLAAEPDAAKKTKFKAEALQMLFDAGNMELAVQQARAVLAENPDDVDANRIIGLSLFASGDKTKYQEAANFLQRYVDKAPDTDPLKASAKESLEYLKTAENVKPEKSQPARPGRRRP